MRSHLLMKRMRKLTRCSEREVKEICCGEKEVNLVIVGDEASSSEKMLGQIS